MCGRAPRCVLASRLLDRIKKLRDGSPEPAPRPVADPPPEPEGPRDHVRRVLSRIEADDLDGALAAALAGTVAFPGYAELWFLRFDLELHQEDLDAGERTLRHIATHDPLNQPGAEICLELLAADRARRAVLAGRAAPPLLGPPTAALTASAEALAALGAGRVAEAERLVGLARERAPRLAGSADDAPFGELRDVDDPLGPVLELLAPGGYRWVALEHVSWIEVLPLRTFLDFAWVPVHVELRGGEELRGHLPGLYAGTGAHPDDRVRLGHETRWERLAPGLSRAAGQRRWQTEDRLIDIRRLHVLGFA